MAAHFRTAVLENTVKWRAVEAVEDVRTYGAADDDVDWATGAGFAVKGHPLIWGVIPPFSSSGVPQWALDRFATLPLSADAAALREIVRRHVVDLVTRYKGRPRASP